MGIPKVCGAVAVVFVGALSLSNCTEKKYINQPITDAVHIHGTVYGWRCGIGDEQNNPYDVASRRFSVTTGEPATISFIRDNGFTSIVETDTASTYELILSAGSHKIVVETGYTYPPDTTYNVQLRPGDTTIILDIVYTVMDPRNITFMFGYHSIRDTAGVRAEWDVICELNRRSYGHKGFFPVFDINSGSPPTDSRLLDTSEYMRRVYVYYRLPVLRSHPGIGKLYNVYEAYLVLRSIIDSDTTGYFPPNFSMSPSGGRTCAFSQ